MMKFATSGCLTPETRSDCEVTITPQTSNSISITLDSKVKLFYGESTVQLVQQTLNELDVEHAEVTIKDAGALPFVIQARVEAAVKQVFPSIKGASLPPQLSSVSKKSSPDQPRRSRLYIPGNQPKLMINAGIHRPDGIILDCEDSVSVDEKISARFIVRNALRTIDFMGAERMVRINQGELGMADIEAIVPQQVDLLLLPKIETPEQIMAIDQKIQAVLKQAGRKGPVYLMPIIESAKGILMAYEIAKASPNNVALAIGLEDYTADIGVERTQEGRESFFARSMIVQAARAVGIQAIDTVYSDVKDADGLRASTLDAKALGFDGKGCIHPNQISVIHEAFAPTETEIERAKVIVLAYDEAQKKGLGVVSLGSKMIDPPVVKRALKIVQKNREANHEL